MLMKMKLDGEKYEVDPDRLSLGEAFLLKKQFGMEDFGAFNWADPEQMIGLFAIAMKRSHPDMTQDEVVAKVETIDIGPVFTDINKQIEAALEKAAKAATDPPKPAANGASAAAGNGSSATTPAKSGSPRTRKR